MAEGGPSDGNILAFYDDDSLVYYDENILEVIRSFLSVVWNRRLSPGEQSRFELHLNEVRSILQSWNVRMSRARMRSLLELHEARAHRQRIELWFYQNPSPMRAQFLRTVGVTRPMSREGRIVVGLSLDAEHLLTPEEYRRYRAIWNVVRSMLREDRFGVEESRETYRRASEVLRPYPYLMRRLDQIPWLHNRDRTASSTEQQPPPAD